MARTKGATSDKFWSEAVRRAVYREDKDDEGRKVKRINLIADKLCSSAMAGDMAAIKEIGDRLDGKPAQALSVSNPDGTLAPQIDPAKLSTETILAVLAARQAPDDEASTVH